jgi:hypothetical protein
MGGGVDLGVGGSEEPLIPVYLPLRVVKHIADTNDVLLVAGGMKILEACKKALPGYAHG